MPMAAPMAAELVSLRGGRLVLITTWMSSGPVLVVAAGLDLGWRFTLWLVTELAG
jgi:hypothetical protein